MSFETLTVTKEGPLAIVTINRPQVLNALNDVVLSELTKCFRDLKKDKDIRGAIITGSGEKSFVAGADIAAMEKMSVVDSIHFVELGHKCMRTIETAPFPVVAAVNGFALGGGLELALSCDFIYASTKAKLGLPEVNLGIFPGFGGTQRLSRLIGKNRAKELVFTANMIGAEEAYAIGIVNKICEPDQLLAEAKKTLETIFKKGPLAVSMAKKAINEGTDLNITSGLALEESMFPVVFATEDKKEGVRAFLEKRSAAFKNH